MPTLRLIPIAHLRRAVGVWLRFHLADFLIVGTWAFAILFAIWIEHRSGIPVNLCVFKRLTGFPCSGCGSTRAVLALSHGDIAQAARLNPLTVGLIFGFPLWVLVRLATRLWMKHDGSSVRVNQWVLILLMLIAVGLNWVWVLKTQHKTVASPTVDSAIIQ